MLALCLCETRVLLADNLDTVGVRLLRQVQPALLGSGIQVGQAEAPLNSSAPYEFEVNPAAAGQPTSLFTFRSALGTSTSFTNTIGLESGHADAVGGNFYGASGGVAPQVTHVDNYEASYFYNTIVQHSGSISDKIVNQSFVFGTLTTNDEDGVLQDYDTFAASKSVLFVSGAGNGGPVYAPSTCYNGLGVAVIDGGSSVGPSYDGRSKPDITAPGSVTSFSTPYVAGSAAVLMQAAARGDGGTNTTAAADMRTVKALLLNGAVKPSGWTNGVRTPLDARYGAGLLNLFNGWNQMSGGRRMFIEATTNAAGGVHPPGRNTTNEPVLTGWDYRAITNSGPASGYSNKVHHYYFNLSTNLGSTFTLTSTLVWNRQASNGAINNLDLFLYNTANSNLVLCSTSAVDNVEHLYVPSLPKGRYDLQVVKNGGSVVSANETYALAFEFFNLQLSIARSNSAVVLSWPISPAGFTLQSSTSLSPPISWSAVSAPVSVVGSSNVVTVPKTNAVQFFRLVR